MAEESKQPKSRTKEQSFQLKMPPEVHHALKIQAVTDKTTITALILKAIKDQYGLGCLA